MSRNFVAYKVTHRDSGKSYIGVTTQKRPLTRWRHHVNVGRRGLGAAIKKYGESAFSFEIIASSWDEPSLLALEMILIAQDGTLSPGGYNLNVGGRGTLRAADETKRLIGEANSRRVWSDESRAKVSASLTGWKMSEARLAAHIVSLTGRKPSAETRAKLSAAAIRRCSTETWKAAVRLSNSTRVVTPETRAKIAASVARHAAQKRG